MHKEQKEELRNLESMRKAEALEAKLQNDKLEEEIKNKMTLIEQKLLTKTQIDKNEKEFFFYNCILYDVVTSEKDALVHSMVNEYQEEFPDEALKMKTEASLQRKNNLRFQELQKVAQELSTILNDETQTLSSSRIDELITKLKSLIDDDKCFQCMFLLEQLKIIKKEVYQSTSINDTEREEKLRKYLMRVYYFTLNLKEMKKLLFDVQENGYSLTQPEYHGITDKNIYTLSRKAIVHILVRHDFTLNSNSEEKSNSLIVTEREDAADTFDLRISNLFFELFTALNEASISPDKWYNSRQNQVFEGTLSRDSRKYRLIKKGNNIISFFPLSE